MTDTKDIHLQVRELKPQVSRRSGVSDDTEVDNLSDNVFFDSPETDTQADVCDKTKDVSNKDQEENQLTLKPFGYDIKGNRNQDKRDKDNLKNKLNEDDTILTLRPFSLIDSSKKDTGNGHIAAQRSDQETKSGKSRPVSSPPKVTALNIGAERSSGKQKKLVRQERVTSDDLKQDPVESGDLTLKPLSPVGVHGCNNKPGKYVSQVEVKNNDESERVGNSDHQDIQRKETIDVPIKDVKKGRMVYAINGRHARDARAQIKDTVVKSNSDTPLITSPEERKSQRARSPEQQKMVEEQQEIPKDRRLKRQRGKRSVSFNQDSDAKVKDPSNEGELTMSKKFRRFARQMSEQSVVTNSIRRKRRKRPNTFFDLALFACCCCCSPLGGLGMVFAVMSDNAHKCRDYRKASKLRKATLGLSICGIILTVVIITIVLIAHAFRRMSNS